MSKSVIYALIYTANAITLVLFRKRITADILSEAIEYLLAHEDDSHPKPPSSGKNTDESGLPKEETGNKGILTMVPSALQPISNTRKISPC